MGVLKELRNHAKMNIISLFSGLQIHVLGYYRFVEVQYGLTVNISINA